MREQVIASRGSRRANTSKGFVQRPARRDGSAAGRVREFSFRALFGYVPFALKGILAILTIIMVIVGYRAAASASMFQVRGIEVTGASRTSAEEIEGLTRRAVARTGVWRADLSALSVELGQLPGVRRAIVTRVLPDRLRVRITERVPLAVLRSSSGHLVWVDEEGVMLGEMKPADRLPPFFIRGLTEDGNDEARADNAARLQKYQEVVLAWETLGLAERVSEVNLIDLHDVRAQLAGNDSQVEVRLGGQDLGNHLKLALEVLDRYKQSMNGVAITYVDLQGDRVILGTSSGNKISNNSDAPALESNSNVEPTPAINRSASAKDQESPSPGDNRQVDRRNSRREDKSTNSQRLRMP
jgi:cell division protein FtsQ